MFNLQNDLFHVVPQVLLINLRAILSSGAARLAHSAKNAGTGVPLGLPPHVTVTTVGLCKCVTGNPVTTNAVLRNPAT
jgi:hypothetical protein